MTEEAAHENGALLPVEARKLYARVAAGETVERGTPGVSVLEERGLAVWDPVSGHLTVVGIDDAERRLRQSVADALTHSVELFSDLASVLSDLRYGQGSRQASASFSPAVFLEGTDAVNRVISAASDTVREDVVSARPGRRSPRTLSLTQDRDAQMLRRGVSVRTLYRASSRGNPAVQDRVRVMSPLGGRFRSLAGPFLAMIVFDRRQAFLADSLEGRPAKAGAWHVRDPAVCAFLADVFEDQWKRADDWFGAASGEDAVSTPLQRAILRELCAGSDQQQIAKALGYSARTINAHLTDLRSRLGLRTVYQLVHWWATSPERELS
ncbi:helix-turn-helix transcriptional regulator [Streptomyces fuscigenes]|uniref:helix-turn-helix transcriptional regulator n=1 Tax=Streptomyces fuscigenes TaxID=1528880 RepID=UPI001F278E93|nr:helix-turn-helix transcriptional regulator [Streptomyces fuscigenes]MCF3962816.1 helix-turn-helix transcriptional regulator [Streptomyces fuscigenes]